VIYRAFAFCLFALCSAAFAQRCLDYVSVDGALLAEPAACYFTDAEDLQSAYIRTDQLTAALGLESAYDPETSVLRFQKGPQTVEIEAVSDPAVGARARDGALKVGGRALRSPSAILAPDRFSYLPLAKLVEAFGGSTFWNAEASLLMVDFNEAAPPVVTPSAATPPPARTRPVRQAATSAPPREAGTRLQAPRYAEHDGYARVALDLPKGTEYRLAVDGENFIALFPGTRAEPFDARPESPHLTSLTYAPVGDTLALIVSTPHPLEASGKGFEVGVLENETGRVLYVDFGRERRGERVARLQDLPNMGPNGGLAAVRDPASVRKTVIIDAGHGGKDPGAISEYVVEKELVLAVALKLESLLEARGIEVILTREDDRYLELEARSAFAVPSEHNLFVSLHANATESGEAHGIETWVFGEPQDDSVIELAVKENGGGEVGRQRTVRAQNVAASIDGDLVREENLAYSTSLARTVQRELIRATAAEDREVRENFFYVIRNARIPAILVELGFINHPEEGPKLATDAYRSTLAEALADGISSFLEPGGALADRGQSDP